MKYIYGIISILNFSLPVFAQGPVEQKCAQEARAALLRNSQQFAENTDSDSSFIYLDGATGGAIEIDLYSNVNTKIVSKVELNSELYTLRSIESLD